MVTVIEQVNSVKNKLRSGEILFGTHIVNTDLQLIELIAGCGFDYLWIDTEHSQADKKDIHDTLMAVRAAGTSVATFVRVADIDPILVKPILEMGPTGIVFPGAQSADDVRRAVSACCYPPKGIRGFGPRACIRYGLEDMTEYVENNEHTVFKIVQLEHKKAYEDLDAIIAVPGVDAFVFGPNDLAGSYGYYRNWKHPEVMAVIDDTIRRVHAAGQYIGVSTGSYDEESLGLWTEKGVDLISVANENMFVMTGCKTALKNLGSVAARLGR
jgi:2-dehydro-3-deoxyglucarate aldolase/4-hydroxy-2-oxoheptanedioate aldolase